MQIGKQKAAFRLKLTDVKNKKSKTITVYEGSQKKSLEQVLTQIIDCLRKND